VVSQSSEGEVDDLRGEVLDDAFPEEESLALRIVAGGIQDIFDAAASEVDGGVAEVGGYGDAGFGEDAAFALLNGRRVEFDEERVLDQVVKTVGPWRTSSSRTAERALNIATPWADSDGRSSSVGWAVAEGGLVRPRTLPKGSTTAPTRFLRTPVVASAAEVAPASRRWRWAWSASSTF
jgi:hypothetical protein